MSFLEFDPALDFKLLLAVPLIPLIGYILQISLRERLPHGDKLLTTGMFVVMCITVLQAAKALYSGGEDFINHSSSAGMELGWLYSGASGDVPTWMNVVIGIVYDPLGAVMLAVVGIVSFCVHLFSQGYMHGDKRYPIFFANISLFTFAMLGLVLSDNILFLFVFWEIMGLMSYLLIGHFSHDPSQPFFHKWATWASKKAFLTTRVGDVCLFIGMFMFYRGFSEAWANTPAFQAALPEFHPLRFTNLWEMARLVVEQNGGDYPGWMTTAGLFVFGGTVGKSAQFPLHIWLPDAMAGPTPVSAMIHAATMVAAGVFLLGRMFPLMSPTTLEVVTFFGATTAIFAATIGMTVYDLKAVLAYSTISQLGFMVAAVGLGGLTAGMFHMTTHAFFKACLFLCAGSVIHGCHHVQDMRVMGGLRKYMPVTFWCTLICTLAIAGVPFFSGFYSKDMIILAAWAEVLDGKHFSGWSLYALLSLSLAAMFTAFYMFRLIFMTFYGEYRGNQAQHAYTAQLAAEGFEGPEPHGHDDHGHDDHGHEAHGHDDHGHDSHGHDSHGGLPHESPLVMTAALVLLAFLGMFGGHFWLLDPGHLLSFWHSEPWFPHLVNPVAIYGEAVGTWVEGTISVGIIDHHSDLAHMAHNRAVILSLFVATTGIVGAWFLYVKRKDLPARIVQRLGLGYTLVRNRYFIDEAIEAAVLKPCMKLSMLQKWIDENVVDGLVLLVGRINKAFGFVSAWFDKRFVDGVVNAVGLVSQGFGAAFRLLQTGRIQQYAAFAVGGGLLTAAWLILS